MGGPMRVCGTAKGTQAAERRKARTIVGLFSDLFSYGPGAGGTFFLNNPYTSLV